MAKHEVRILLGTEQEISLMGRYGRKCSRQSLVERAVAEAIALKTPWTPPVKTPRKKEPDAQATLPVCICGGGGTVPSPNCPVPSHRADYADQLHQPEDPDNA